MPSAAVSGQQPPNKQPFRHISSSAFTMSNHSLFKQAKTAKRAASEDSDDHRCSKRTCSGLTDVVQAGAVTASAMASMATADAVSCLTEDKATDSAWRTSGQGLEGLLAASTAEAIAASQNAYTDTQKLLAVLQEVTAARDSFRAEANTAQAAEVRARSAESESRAASHDAQQATQSLQLLLASCTAERDRFEEQRAKTARANAEARALSQQSQQDAQALHEAAAEARAMCKALSSQVSELPSAKAEAQATVQSAQRMSDKLDVDVEAARLTLESHTTQLQTVTADGLAACTALQASTDDATQQCEQHLGEAQAQRHEATEAALHAQAAEAEATAAAAMACAKAEAMPAALKHQQLMDLSKEVIVGAQKEQSTVAQQPQHQSDDQIVAALRREVAAATHGTDWKGLQAAAQEARRLLEGVADEIKSSVASATHAAKAEIASAVETAAAAAVIQSLGAPCQAGTSQGMRGSARDVEAITAAKKQAYHEIHLAVTAAVKYIRIKAVEAVSSVPAATQTGGHFLQPLETGVANQSRLQPPIQRPLGACKQAQGVHRVACSHQAL